MMNNVTQRHTTPTRFRPVIMFFAPTILSNHGVIRRLYSNLSGQIKAQKYVLTKHFKGEPKKDDFEIIEEEIPDIKNGEILTKAEYLSVDPYMRAYMIRYKLPADMIGGQVAKIISSRNEKFPEGKYVVGSFGWRTHTVVDPNQKSKGMLPLVLLPDVDPHPVSVGLGPIGLPGLTAYFGIKEVCKVKPGETIVITGAAGAVGCHAGQLAKNLGCRVIGFAGTDEKCQYLTKELGFHKAYNYKTANIRNALKDGAPNKVDCYFDNVGGEISTTIMNFMNKYGRVAVCGAIASYNDDFLPKATITQPGIVVKELKVEGFLATRWNDQWQEGVEANLKMLREGKLKYNEKVYNGFESMVDALNGMLRGENTGKAIVKV